MAPWTAGTDQQGRTKNKNKTLGTERCENVETLYINKIIIININACLIGLGVNVSDY